MEMSDLILKSLLTKTQMWLMTMILLQLAKESGLDQIATHILISASGGFN
jgi:hypothetical protein